MKLFDYFPCKLIGQLITCIGYNNKCSINKENKMSVKTSVIDILTQNKLTAIQNVGQVYDTMITAVNTLPDDVPGDVTALQDQVTTLQGQLDAANQAIQSDAATLTAEKSKEAQLQAVIDAVKAALNPSVTPN